MKASDCSLGRISSLCMYLSACHWPAGGSEVCPAADARRVVPLARGFGIGIDIGSRMLRVAAVRRTRKGQIALTHFGQAPTPEGAVRDGVIVEPADMAGAVRALGREAGLRGGQVTAAIHGQGVLIRHLQLPEMPQEELAEAVRWEAEGQLPFPIADAVMDFAVLGPAGDDSGEIEVLVAAAPQRLAEQLVEILQKAGFRPGAVDCTAFALLRSFALSTGNDLKHLGDEPVAILDLGATKLSLTIIRRGQIRFTRTAAIGGDLITQRIARDRDLSFSAAERLKLAYGFVEPVAAVSSSAAAGELRIEAGRQFEAQQAGEDSHLRQQPEDLDTLTSRIVVEQAVSEFYSDLLEEIRRSLDYYRVLTQWQESVGRLILTGGGARLSGLVESLRQDLGLPVELLWPGQYLISSLSKRSRVTMQKVDSSAAICIGLALRDVVDI